MIIFEIFVCSTSLYSYFYVNDKGFSEYLYIQLQYFWLNLEISSSLNPILSHRVQRKQSRAVLLSGSDCVTAHSQC